MRSFPAAAEHPGTCLLCGSAVEQYADSAPGIDHVCPVCLTDLSVPDPGPLVHPGLLRSRRGRARLRH
jgi:hypothetical protein